MRLISILILTTFLSSCVNYAVNTGVKHYNAGRYKQAANLWMHPAHNGNLYAQYNMGLLSENGVGGAIKNGEEAAKWYILAARQGHLQAMEKVARYQLSIGQKENAISWLRLSARWGHQPSVIKLIAIGEKVPPDDLRRQKIAQEKQEKQNSHEVLGVLALGMIAGYYVTPAPLPIIANPKNSQQNTIYLSNNCTSDYTCKIGFSCVKPLHKSTGQCMATVSDQGLKILSSPKPSSLLIKTSGQCTFDTECPIGFRCDNATRQCLSRY